ncbi:hypothetical protein [Caulobacter sp. 1776]|uniref:hypothetical protein n=1 Tax=Caulobacter sp. 1776 TaxID=3156420 RepID=UPI00339211F0
MTEMMKSNGRRIAAWSVVAALIATPWVAMQFTAEVKWTLFDFALFGGLLVGSGLVLEFAAWKAHSLAYRAGVGLALAASVLLVLVTGAVGIIGSEANAANLMYAAVLLVAIGGSAMAGFKAGGMAHAMGAAALVQVAIMIIALVGDLGAGGAIWPRDLIGATAVFAALWLASAGLFRKAALKEVGA